MTPSAPVLRAVVAAQEAATSALIDLYGADHPLARQAEALLGEVRHQLGVAERRTRIADAAARFVGRRTE